MTKNQNKTMEVKTIPKRAKSFFGIKQGQIISLDWLGKKKALIKKKMQTGELLIEHLGSKDVEVINVIVVPIWRFVEVSQEEYDKFQHQNQRYF